MELESQGSKHQYWSIQSWHNHLAAMRTSQVCLLLRAKNEIRLCWETVASQLVSKRAVVML
jgi:hypothetical protein